MFRRRRDEFINDVKSIISNVVTVNDKIHAMVFVKSTGQAVSRNNNKDIEETTHDGTTDNHNSYTLAFQRKWKDCRDNNYQGRTCSNQASTSSRQLLVSTRKRLRRSVAIAWLQTTISNDSNHLDVFPKAVERRRQSRRRRRGYVTACTTILDTLYFTQRC